MTPSSGDCRGSRTKVGTKLENFDGLREVEATVGQLRLLEEVVAK